MPATSVNEYTLPKTCPCAPCDCHSLAHPTLEPTAAELWVSKSPQSMGHADSAQRVEYIERFGYAILNRPTVEIIRPYGPLLEIASGLGYWARELQHRGIHTVATDPHPEKEWPSLPPWTNIHRMDGLKALEAYPGYNLPLLLARGRRLADPDSIQLRPQLPDLRRRGTRRLHG